MTERASTAASGTALATGHKTKNGTLGLAVDRQTPIQSVAAKAQANGKRVGVATSVSVDHATPAAFYAHVPDRGMYYEIGKDLVKAGFDFYAGSDFLNPSSRKAPEEGTLYEQCQKAGYTIARGYKDYGKKRAKADKMILFQTEEASKKDRTSIPYAIDRKKGDMTLAEITRAGINFLSKGDDNGFFLMVEGGKIDWACHANDAATAFNEVIDFDNAIRVAYEFYEQHPDETLIVVTADHETGGIVLGKALAEALGDKSGIVRFGSAYVPMDEALSFCAVDISGRPYLVFDAEFTDDRTGTFDNCLTEEFFRAFAFNAGITLHVKNVYGRNDHHKIESMFKAVAYALKTAVRKNSDGSVVSTKGTL